MLLPRVRWLTLDTGGRRRSSTLSDRITRLDVLDAESRYDEEEADRGIGALHNIRSRTRSRTNEVVINWAPNDPENPYNWSYVRIVEGDASMAYIDERIQLKKTWILICTVMLVINSTMGSALPSMAIPDILDRFNVTVEEQFVLPISVYLIGYVFGPIVWGPLSEHYGRRILSIITFALFCIFTMACALAPNWPALLIFRFFTGAFASSPIAIVAGILADVYNDPKTRGRAFAIFIVVGFITLSLRL